MPTVTRENHDDNMKKKILNERTEKQSVLCIWDAHLKRMKRTNGR